MIFDLKDNCFVIDTQSDKLPYNITDQLKYYGFMQSKNIFIKKNINPRDINKVINYYNEKSYKYSVTKSFQKHIDELKRQDEVHSKKIDILNKFKNGQIGHDAYDQNFLDSLKTLKQPLRDHQIKASYHLYLSECAALFSVPGSGKTRCVLMLYKLLLEANKVDKIFIIGPISSHGAWMEEFEIFFNKRPTVARFVGGDPNYRKARYRENLSEEMVLSSYQTMSNDIDSLIPLLNSNKFLMILDEAHYIKNSNGKWSSAILTAADFVPYRVALTGTPMPQKFNDLFNIFDFISPDGNIINSIDKIKLEQDAKDNNYDLVKKKLHNLIGPFFYRVRKKDLGLKEQLKNNIFIKMNNYERKIYESVNSQIVKNSKNDSKYHSNINYLNNLKRGRMIRLRQVYSNVALLSNTIPDYDEDLLINSDDLKSIVSNYLENELPAKLEKLLIIVDKHASENKKLIIWSNFIGTINLIENKIREKGHLVKKIIGSTPPDLEEYSAGIDSRESIKRDFNNPKSNLLFLIANPAACAEAISLHKACDSAVYYDLSYNCAHYLQSLDRIHRLGASEIRPSHYYFLKYENTDEYKIFENIEKKSKYMSSIIDTDYDIYHSKLLMNDDDINAYDEIFESKNE